MTLSQLILIVTGLFLFLFGMIKLSAGMQQIFSVRIRQYIKCLVKKPISGMGIGAVATALFQSSSATTVLVVGMVGAGLISFFNSLGLILGAGIGTTITAQLVALKITAIAPIFIILGIFIWFIGKSRAKAVGETIFYFGLLFFGLGIMGEGLSLFKDNSFFLNLIKETSSPLIGILIGFVFTALVQSSSATTGILVILAQQGLVGIESAFPIILGANIGTTITAILASAGAGKNAKRSAFSHFFFKFFGVLVVLPFLPLVISLLKNYIYIGAQQVVIGHLLFNVLIVLIFIFLLKPFSLFMKKIIPGKEKILPLWPEYLDKRLLYNSKKSFEAVSKELNREMVLAQDSYYKSIKLFESFNKTKIRDIFYIDKIIDNLQREIMCYLDKVSRLQLSKKDTTRLFCYSSMVDDIERIGDHTTNLAHLLAYKNMGKVYFSRYALQEIDTIEKLVAQNIKDAKYLITRMSKNKIKLIFEREKKINKLVKKAREHHLDRFYRGICLAMAGPIFNDILVNLERISDHCANIAEYAEQLS